MNKTCKQWWATIPSRPKRKEEGHDGSKDDPPLAFDNSKFEQAIQLLPKVYDKLKDELRYVWKICFQSTKPLLA
jgi:hypothetical protein